VNTSCSAHMRQRFVASCGLVWNVHCWPTAFVHLKRRRHTSQRACHTYLNPFAVAIIALGSLNSSSQPLPPSIMIGRLLHYTVDAVLLSTVLAGVRRSSGFAPATNSIQDDTIRSIADKYLGVGETIFDMFQGTAVNSQYFKRDGRK